MSFGSSRAIAPVPRDRGAFCRLLPVLLLAFLGSAAASSTSVDFLTLDQALRFAEQRSRALVAHDSAASAAREMAGAAGQRPDPTLKAGINNLPLNGPDRFSLSRDFMTMRSIGVMQELTRAEKLRARAARFDSEAELAQATRQGALADLQRETATAWLDRHYQERIHAVLVAQRNEARLQVEAADAAYRGGRGSQADVFAAHSMVSMIEDRMAQSEQQVATARTRLSRWVGAPAAQALAAPPPTDAVGLDPSTLEAQLVHHPRILTMAKQEEVARAEVDIARSNTKSDWTVELMVSDRGSAFSDMVSLNVSVPLQWDQRRRQDREVSAKVATAEQMRAQREEAAREHVAETLAMFQEWQSNRDRLTRYDESLIPLAAERTRASIAAYRGASGNLTGVLEARRSEIDTRVERLRLESETARLWAQLNYLFPAGEGVTAHRR